MVLMNLDPTKEQKEQITKDIKNITKYNRIRI